MHIVGFDKLSLLNYPGKVACTIFTAGCNFRCPFCHNASIVEKDNEELSEEEIFSYLKKRKGIIDAVCITGGEPLLQTDIIEFIIKLKSFGLAIKLDTNGYLPEILQQIIDQKLVDYIAMDIKNSDDKYSKTNGTPCFDINRINKSIELIENSGIEYEFRTTLVAEYHEESDIKKICQKLVGAKRYFLQNFEDSGDIIEQNLHGFEKTKLVNFLSVAKNYISGAELRGV